MSFKAVQAEISKTGSSIPESFDARDWAKEFVVYAKANPSIATDEGTMATWFANALMRGYDEHYWRSSEYKRKVRSVLVPWWKRLFVPLDQFGHPALKRVKG